MTFHLNRKSKLVFSNHEQGISIFEYFLSLLIKKLNFYCVSYTLHAAPEKFLGY